MIELELGDPRWRKFVRGEPEATAFHHPAWAELLEDCYGYRPFVLAATDEGGGLVAGLPVMEVRRRWVALPFTDVCPPLGGGADFAVELDTVRREARVAQLEVRAALVGPGVHTTTSAVVHTLALSPDPDEVFARFRDKRTFRQAERAGVAVRRGEAARDLTDTFYGLHVRTRRRLGVPVQPRRFFELLWDRLDREGLGFVLVAAFGGEPVAAAVFLAMNQTVTYKFGASDPQFLGLRPNNLLFWSAIRWGCEHGYRRFDFGRSDLANEGLRRFKRGFGASEEPLPYSTLADRAPHAPSGRLERAAGSVIRRSPPWVCRGIGELLYKYAA
jgi:CelD/BcsL family acetyltransferase involved in cellulose biosynthesis